MEEEEITEEEVRFLKRFFRKKQVKKEIDTSIYGLIQLQKKFREEGDARGELSIDELHQMLTS
jgi:hypothetical protein